MGSVSNEDIEGVGLALSINEANEVIEDIMNTPKPQSNSNEEKGRIPRLGIVGEEAVYDLNNKDIKGIYVRDVIKGSGAAEAGLKPTDIIVEVDSVKVAKIKELEEAISRHAANDTLNCKILRGGQIVKLLIKLL